MQPLLHWSWLMAHSHCTGPGNDGFLYYAMYCTHYTGTGTGYHCYRPQRSLGQGNVFTRLSFCSREGGGFPACIRGLSPGGSVSLGVCIGGGGRWAHTPEHYGYGQQVSSTHPTGMHSCFLLCPSWTLSLSRSRSRAECISH